jgi:hypothetical protein
MPGRCALVPGCGVAFELRARCIDWVAILARAVAIEPGRLVEMQAMRSKDDKSRGVRVRTESRRRPLRWVTDCVNHELTIRIMRRYRTQALEVPGHTNARPTFSLPLPQHLYLLHPLRI